MRQRQIRLASLLVWIAVVASLMGFWRLWPKGGLLGLLPAIVFETLIAIVLVVTALMVIALQRK